MDMNIQPDTVKFATKTACVAFAHGCPRSKTDAAGIVEYLKTNGWSMTTRFEDASLVLVSACAGDDFAEEKSMILLSVAYQKLRPDAQMVVFGCLPGINPDRLHAEFDAVTLTPATMGELDAIIGAQVALADIKQPNTLHEYDEQFDCCFSRAERTFAKLRLSRKFMNKALVHLLHNRGPARLSNAYGKIFEIKVVQGCLGECTYCAIRFGEGELISRPMDKVLEDFHAGIDAGYKAFRLLGGDVGAYGQDTGTGIPELLREIFTTKKEFKLVWDDFGPNWLVRYFPELSDLFAEYAGNIGYLGFPTQTGSDRILALMKRTYTVDEVRHCLRSLAKSVHGIDLTTHIIVGFPGETEEDFSMTLDFMNDVGFRQAEVFKYSDRPGTEASNMKNKVPEIVKSARLWRLRLRYPETCVLG